MKATTNLETKGHVSPASSAASQRQPSDPSSTFSGTRTGSRASEASSRCGDYERSVKPFTFRSFQANPRDVIMAKHLTNFGKKTRTGTELESPLGCLYEPGSRQVDRHFGHQ
ncbi:hypothetical protein AAVH_43203 [Aphelenchoides avenae]|nr:hypothetical protein AAVH_43203 [Aphelenchus avenae]